MTNLAHQAAQQHVFGFQNFHIDKSQPLGHGSYGAVYKAKCDQLPCAAKLIHATILDPTDSGADMVMRRFEQECAFLESIRHPNIVQYLSVTSDPESRLPVLLMELLDESLTKMLEHSQQPLPYYVQVDICYDIALAVAYLHYNDIIHRDLSSNNVLMIAGRRAKVTDFGMSKLAGAAPTMTPLTMCPGTLAYMAPEALREPPSYTKKLDCFSEGVIMIQVCTRLWPEPGPRTRLVPFPESPTGIIEMPVLEMERRKNHIDLVEPSHPFLPIAVDCLHYKEEERPSSEQLCQRLAALKESREYKECAQNQCDCVIHAKDNQSTLLTQQLHETDRGIHVKTDQLQQHQEEKSQLQTTLQKEIKQLQQQRRTYEEKMASQERQIQQLSKRLEEQKLVKAENQQINCSAHRQVDQPEQDLGQHGLQNPDIKPHRPKVSAHRQVEQPEQDLCQLGLQNPDIKPHPPKVSAHKQIEQPEQDLGQHGLQNPGIKPHPPKVSAHKQIEQPEQDLGHLGLQNPNIKPHPPKVSADRQVEQPEQDLCQNGPDLKQHPPKVLQNTLEWRDGGKAPSKMVRGVAVTDVTDPECDMVYFMNWNGEVHSYNSSSEKWSELPKSPYRQGSLAVIMGQLTSIGGCEGTFRLTYTNKLLSLNKNNPGKRWTDVFPPMPSKRCLVTAVTSTEHLIVAGGSAEPDNADVMVEVMDTKTLVWSTAASLPHPYSMASATICGDRLYMLGGRDDKGKTKSVLTCSLTELLQSSPSSSSVWHRVADAPGCWSACTALNGELLAVGGCDETRNPIATIHKYKPANDSWDLFSNLQTARWLCLVAVLPTNVMIAAGGYISSKVESDSDKVEIAHFSYS